MSTAISHYGALARSALVELGAPPVALESVSLADAAGYGQAPRAGCERPPGSGRVRMWGAFDLMAWHDAAAHLWPHSTEQIAALSAAAQALRQSGEGAQVWWAIDILDPEDLTMPWDLDYALFVTDLVCAGTPLGPAVLSEVGDVMEAASYGLLGEPNTPASHGVLSVCTTTWAYGV